VARYLIGETSCDVTGVDIDADNIAWCRQAYPGGTFHTVPLQPPTELAGNTFDLVIGLSVLTHLREDDQWRWLAELRRITRPGALLLLSVMGPTLFAYSGTPPHLIRRLQQEGYIDLSHGPTLDAVINDNEYYRVAWHSHDYIVRRWSEYFDVLAIEDALASAQDLVVLRRRHD
jgi:SAM-dependent methyltransferase